MWDDSERGAVWTARGFSFVGRERELGLLLEALRRPPAVVLVAGEAGIGKSRLVREAAAALTEADGRVLFGYCHPLREPVPFGPVIDAFRKAGRLLPPVEEIPRTAGALVPLLPDLADRLPDPPPRLNDARADRRQLVQGVQSFLTAVGPVVLVIEDMHWVDEITRELVLLLTRDMPEQLGLVLTFRDEDIGSGTLLGSALRRQPGTGGTTIHLTLLSEQDVEALALDALGGEADESLRSALYRRSQGLPLAAEEDLITLREHRHRGQSARAVDLEHAEVPHGLRESFIERFTALPPAGKAIVNAAAVLAIPADQELLTRLAGLSEDQGSYGITEALRGAVLRETGSAAYTFRHVLAQQAAYENIPGPERHRLHELAARLLETRSPPPLVQIAHHTLKSGDRDGWLVRAKAAADQSIALGDDGTAAALLHQILEQPDLPDQTRTHAALALSRIAVNGTDYTANATVLRRILADPRLDAAARGDIRLSLGLLVVNQIGDRDGYREIGRSVAELSDQPERAARAMIAMAMNEQDGASDQAWTWMERAERTLDGSRDEAMHAATQATRLTLMARSGDPAVWDGLDRMPRQSTDIEVIRHTIRALFNVGEIAVELGHDRKARELLAEGRELTRRVDFPWLESYTRIAQLRLQSLAGEWECIEGRFAALEHEYPDIAMATSERALTIGRVAAARGQRALALELFTSAAELGKAESQVTTALRAAAGLTALRITDGAAQDAWSAAEPAVRMLRRAAAWARGTGLVPVAVEAALACDDRVPAQQLVDDAERGLAGRDAPAATAELRFARGLLLGPTKAASEHFGRARDLWTDIGRPYDAAQATERMASALATDSPKGAAARLEDALTAYSHLGATYDAARCEHTRRQLGLSRPSSRGRRGYGDQLSPRERQVAEFLARGATNHQIAEALFLSPRTVELHVAHVLRKLNTARKDVGAALHAPGSSR